MEDLDIEDLKQLLLFYKQRASDVEFNLLQTQVKLNKLLSVKNLQDQSLKNKPLPEKNNK